MEQGNFGNIGLSRNAEGNSTKEISKSRCFCYSFQLFVWLVLILVVWSKFFDKVDEV